MGLITELAVFDNQVLYSSTTGTLCSLFFCSSSVTLYSVSISMSPGDRIWPWVVGVRARPTRALTLWPANSAGTEIFISIFMDSITHSSWPSSSTSPTLTL